jgi:transposase-like protein
MAPGLHGSARTTPRVRAELQAAQATTRGLAARHGLNPKTAAKWRRRTTTADRPMGPARPRSTVLTEAEEAIVVESRRRTLLPLDDLLGCLRETIPGLSRSALHRRLARHGISRLPRDEERASKRKRFAETKIGYVDIDACEPRLAQGELFMFLAIDRVPKFAHVAFSTPPPS